jgi:hypothetical protein
MTPPCGTAKFISMPLLSGASFELVQLAAYSVCPTTTRTSVATYSHALEPKAIVNTEEKVTHGKRQDCVAPSIFATRLLLHCSHAPSHILHFDPKTRPRNAHSLHASKCQVNEANEV